MPFYLLRLRRVFPRWCAIIGALCAALALGGCSAVRLGYTTAPNIAYWWLDSYFDFSSTQSPAMRADLQDLQQWHRTEELPLVAQVLKNLQAAAPSPVTPAQVCTLVDYLQTRLQATADRFIPALSTLAPTLQAAQLEHVSREFDKRNTKWRDEWLDGPAQDTIDRRTDQMVDRAESFYGKLDATQVALVRNQIVTSGFDAAVSYRETLRRQQDALQVLRELRTPGMPEARVQASLRAFMARSLASPDAQYREYLEKLTLQSCASLAALHNSTTPRQRQKLAQTLQNYETDVRALMRN
jgi:hypothetical protein